MYLTSMATAFHILSVGYDPQLMQTRSMLLRRAGFVVDEGYNLRSVLGCVKSDSIDALVLCHTIPENEQRWLISAVRKVRRLLPIICVRASVYDSPQEGCVVSTNEPREFLAAIGKAIQHPLEPRSA
jgi:DNA-binding NtrC family response regulator